MRPLDGALVHGLRTHVLSHGDGQPVLLIGGVWSQASLWLDLLPHLDRFRTIAFDPPGLGGTDMPRRPYTVRRLAEFAAGVLDAAGVESAHVIGVSHGGAVAQELALRFPHRVDRLVLVSTGFGAPGMPGRPGALLRFASPHVYRDPDALELNAGRMFGGRLRQQPELVHSRPLRSPGTLKAYLYRLGSTLGWSSLPWLGRLHQPTLVVHGDDDPIVPLLNGRVLARQIPHARLHLVRGGGHLLLLDSAERIFPVITDFLDANDVVRHLPEQPDHLPRHHPRKARP